MSCRSPSEATAPEPAGAPDARRFWRSLEELAGSPEFTATLAGEFPRHASAWDGTTDRRRFLELMGASLALAGMSGCSQPPPERIMPYVRAPQGLTAGLAQQFATAMPRSDGALGLVVTSHMGRPTKVEGNPLHGASLGATDAWAQASILTMYDPDRSQTVLRLGDIATWDQFVTQVRADLESAGRGTRMAVVSGPVSSPTLLRQREALTARFPDATWYEYEPASRGGAVAGAQLAFGEPLASLNRLASAEIVVSLDADFLGSGSSAVRDAREFMERRGQVAAGASSNRLYVVESTPSPTGATADHRLPLPPSGVMAFTRALAARFGVGPGPAGEVDAEWLTAVAEDLDAARGRSLVIAGDHQPAELHALVHAINGALGNIGATVEFVTPPAPMAAESRSLDELAGRLAAGEIDWLVLLEVNPVYDTPAELDFAALVRKPRHSIHLGLFQDETAELCRWHVPAAHFLESWSDVRSADGTAAIVQPLTAPLYDGVTVHELLSALVEPVARPAYDIVRETWQAELADDFERGWHAALADGVIAESAFEATVPSMDAGALAAIQWPEPEERGANADAFELTLLPDPTVGDGRMANNGWLQELPKPITKITWENAIHMAPAAAERLRIQDGDVVRLDWQGRSVAGPVCLVPGHAAGSLTCHFGYGRTRAGRTGTGIGFSAYRLLAADRQFVGRGVTVTKTGGHVELARTQKHHVIAGERNIIHSATLAQFREDPDHVLPEALHHPLPSLYPEDDYKGFAWGMAIDLSKCLGCNSCVVACQAENNIPVVGKEGVERGREMHWLRIDAYFEGTAENPVVHHQPMLCQHCEKAPCEVVCPVAATTHSDEGLNEMTYNRCIGTRYCSNNCPYKVRRFNFFDYTGDMLPVVQLGQNPNVTVRSRGVMEKCTYCVQRIDRARIEAKKDAVEAGAPPAIADGTLMTACQQACPTRAIVFGDINDPTSRVSQMKADPRNYGVLSELGTQPRTSYLARLRNPNPRLG